VCGDDADAKQQVVELLRSFGWPPERILDLGDLTAARGTEAYLLLWLRLWGTFQTGHLNIKVLR
jgi:predicted dinucleotide-binding enzyme